MNYSSRLRLSAAAVTVSALTSLGFSLASISSGGLYAQYALARSGPLALVTVGVVLARSRAGILTMSLLVGLVQGSDAMVGFISHDIIKTVGPLFLAVVTLLSAGLLHRQDEQSTS